jgi:hypothetical protein
MLIDGAKARFDDARERATLFIAENQKQQNQSINRP